MNNYTELIDKYLNGQLSESEKIDFENELKTNSELKKEFEIQKQITENIKYFGTKLEIKNSLKKINLTNNFFKMGAIFTVLSIGGLLVYYFSKNNFDNKTINEVSKIDLIFNLETDKDTIIETPNGLIIGIPANAFDTDKSNIELVVDEALNPLDIMKKGLSTESDGNALVTAGMFKIEAKDGEKLIKKISVNVPTDKIDDDIMLFEGKKDESGKINWINPKKVKRNLRTYNIENLDFYPNNFLPTLKSLGYNIKKRKLTDSIYYSFSGYNCEKNNYEILSESYYIDFEGKKRYLYRDSQMYEYQNDIASLEIDPSRIKAIKTKEFNNTILATKEFQERIKFIHTLCEVKYFNVYLNNLDKTISYCDSVCMSLSSDEVKKKFEEFYKRNDGGVEITSEIQFKLNQYFETKFKIYQEAALKTWEKYYNDINKFHEDKNTKLSKIEKIEDIRENKVFQEELCLNLVEAYNQIGQKRDCPETTTPPAPQYYNVEISNTSWYNLDKYVLSATKERKTINYESPDGKKATITYSPIEVLINNRNDFDVVYVYLIPDNLNSFQRFKDENNKFTQSLNGLLKCNIRVIAYKKDEIYTAKINNVEPQKYSISLTKTSEKNLKKELSKFSKNKTIDFVQEIINIKLKQEMNLKEIKINEKNQRDRIIASSIFACECCGEPESIGIIE